MIIYKATNLLNNKVYIGQTKNSLDYRKQQHLNESKSLKKKTVYFHNALNKYGFENFKFEQIDVAFSQKELDEKERYWIKYYNSNNRDFGYNLDSGGKSGGEKSESTKHKIGITTKIKWENPETAQKMLEGLKKGTETIKKRSILNKIPFKCPVCENTYYYNKYQLKNRKYCSNKCASKDGKWIKGVTNSGIKNHERNIKRKYEIKQDIIKWLFNNKEIINNCPYNKIETNLIDLKQILISKYNIKDFRTIFICFNVRSKKELLKIFKDIVSKENIC